MNNKMRRKPFRRSAFTCDVCGGKVTMRMYDLGRSFEDQPCECMVEQEILRLKDEIKRLKKSIYTTSTQV